jgi:hypothetical protein
MYVRIFRYKNELNTFILTYIRYIYYKGYYVHQIILIFVILKKKKEQQIIKLGSIK